MRTIEAAGFGGVASPGSALSPGEQPATTSAVVTAASAQRLLQILMCPPVPRPAFSADIQPANEASTTTGGESRQTDAVRKYVENCSLDHEVQVLDDPSADRFVAGIDDGVVIDGRATACEPGEDQGVEADRRRRFCVEFVDHLGALIDGHVDGARQRAGQLEPYPRPFRRPAELADHEAHARRDLVEGQSRVCPVEAVGIRSA